MNYQAIYDNLIKKSQAYLSSGYVEKHHILPKSMGGTNESTNIVKLTAREHFIAHWLLFKIFKTPAMAKAFRLMLDSSKKPKSKSYELAKSIYAESMRGNNNVSKRPSVRQKLKDNCFSPFSGKKRPEHSLLMKSKELWVGNKNPFYGLGNKQMGLKNHMAKSVIGKYNNCVTAKWDTLTEASKDIGVSLQAICQAIKKQTKSKGWDLSYDN
jgi:hypothetical protein